MKESRAYMPRSMRFLITIQRPVQTKNTETGEWILTYSNWTVRWADKEYESIRNFETVSSEKISSSTIIKYHTRYIQGLTTKDRLIDNGEIFEIVDIEVNGTDHMHVISAINVK